MDISREFHLMLTAAIREQPQGFAGFDSTKNVQDQLQEMVEIEGVPSMEAWTITYYPLPQGRGFHRYEMSLFSIRITEGETLEQLWLAFVMKERFRKVWNGSDWVKDGS